MLSGYIPVSLQDSSAIRSQKPDSITGKIISGDSTVTEKRSDDTLRKTIKKQERTLLVIQDTDTTSVCLRNPVADVTFWNYDYILSSINNGVPGCFPFQFIEKNQKITFKKRETIEKRLRPGSELPDRIFHYDWNVIVLLVTVLLFSIAISALKSLIPGTTRFYLFRGTGDEGIRDVQGIFQWQTTLLNLSAFLVIALFGFFATEYYHLIPGDISGFIFWALILGAIILAVTLRHLTCFLTGLLSTQESVFADYLHTFYQSYRLTAFFLFFLTVMISYTSILPERSYFPIGFVIFSVHYLIRILRLFLIFINRNISIFYLILYLCALEILPVLIVIRFFSGLG
jgi:hypothetical protein